MLGAPARPQTHTQTLSHALFPQQTLIRHAVLVVAASMFMALSAQVSITLAFGPVPITGQTFAVLLVGALLGPWLGMAAAALYVAEGVGGLPVYASGASGWGVITGASGGYLLSYPLTTLLVGWLAQRGWDRRPLRLTAAMLLGSVVIYACGLPWLYAWGATHEALAGIERMTLALTLQWGLLPFIPGDLAKLLLAAGLVPSGWQLLRPLRLGPTRRAPDEAAAPSGAHAAPVAVAAGLTMLLGALLPWTPGATLGTHSGAAWVVAAAGIAGAAGAALRGRGRIGAGVAQLWGFAAGAAGGLLAFTHLVEFTAAGDLGLAPVAVGVVLSVVAALVLLATTAMEAAAE